MIFGMRQTKKKSINLKRMMIHVKLDDSLFVDCIFWHILTIDSMFNSRIRKLCRGMQGKTM